MGVGQPFQMGNEIRKGVEMLRRRVVDALQRHTPGGVAAVAPQAHQKGLIKRIIHLFHGELWVAHKGRRDGRPPGRGKDIFSEHSYTSK